MRTLTDAVSLAGGDQGLAVVSTLRSDPRLQSSVINAALLEHPATAVPGRAFVTYGAVKLNNLRMRPRVAVTFRRGWQWATVEGHAELAGPDDPQWWLTGPEQLRVLLREIFSAAGGTNDD